MVRQPARAPAKGRWRFRQKLQDYETDFMSLDKLNNLGYSCRLKPCRRSRPAWNTMLRCYCLPLRSCCSVFLVPYPPFPVPYSLFPVPCSRPPARCHGLPGKGWCNAAPRPSPLQRMRQARRKARKMVCPAIARKSVVARNAERILQN
jgi:hypothetical protein